MAQKESNPEAVVPSKSEVRRLYASWYVYMILGVLVALLLPEPVEETNVFLPSQLAKFDGKQEPKRYLAILGKVFDVTEGEPYTEEGGYNFFVGKDASRAFSTGEFEGDAKDYILDLEPGKVMSVVNWRTFYETHEVYKYVGKVEGRYYNSKGEPEPDLTEINKIILSEEEKKNQLNEWEKDYPGCNSRWTSAEGSSVWCADKMISHRPLTAKLVPRRVFVPAAQQERCHCIELDKAEARPGEFHAYDKCDPKDSRCDLGFPPAEKEEEEVPAVVAEDPVEETDEEAVA